MKFCSNVANICKHIAKISRRKLSRSLTQDLLSEVDEGRQDEALEGVPDAVLLRVVLDLQRDWA